MPKTYNTAGDSTRQMASDRRRQGLLWGIVAMVGVIVVYLLMTNHASLGIGGGGILVLLLALRLIPDFFDSYSRKQEKKIRRAERGAKAEEDIGDLLDGLPDGFIVLHDVDSPYGNIDHIVVSQKGGIFLLETKSHGGKVITTASEILLNGHATEKDFIAQALSNSLWLRDECEKLLKVTPWVIPVVVFTNAFVSFGKPVKGVRVINKKYLLGLLKEQTRANSINSQIWEKRKTLVARLLGISPEPDEVSNQSAKFCPKCGAQLEKRIVQSGVQAGKEFMVCSKYPECKTAIPSTNAN